MKKIALALLSLFLTTPCLANIHINPSTVESVVKEFVPADKMVSVISEYNNQLKQSNGTGISAQKLWNICAIAGWDIKQPSDKSQCQKFVNALVEKSSIKFYHACDKQYKGKAGYICVDDFFTNKIYGGTQVNLTPGQTLAKEYARLKHNDSTVQCRNKFDPGTLDDTLMCTSHNKNAYYEFVFDDLEEPKDQTIKNSIQNAICRMYDAKPTTAGCAGGGTNVSGTATCWSASCAADSAKCAKINQSMAKFGYSAIYKDNKCEINFNSINDKSKLKTAYGIDNFVFCHGIQVANTPNVETYLKQYVAERAGVSASSVKCDSGFNTYTGTGCTANGITDIKDDIKTCRVGNNQIDFVFDDINEKWKKTVEGGVQGMSCIVTGGTYSGERCIGLGEQQCNTLRQSNLKECPECKAAKWDKETQSCLLPSSKSAQNLQKGVNIGLIVGGAVVGVALTVVTAGAAGAPVTAIVLTGIETVGAGIELTSQLKINGIVDDFLVESNKCENATCAKKMLSQNLQRMANYANDMTAAEADAVDSEMARLANLIPDDDEIWATMLVNGTDMADNKLGFFDTDSWEPEQVWRAVGIGLQLASLITGITKWAISKSSRVVKSTAAIKQKFARAIQSIDNAPESTLRAKRLALKQQIINAKKVADNPLPQIPKTQLAADFRGYDVIPLANGTVKPVGLGQVLFDAPSQYPQMNKLETEIKKLGGEVLSYLDSDAKAVYRFGAQDSHIASFENYLNQHGFKYSRQGNYFTIKESDLAQSFPQYAHLENPIITQIDSRVGNSVLDEALDADLEYTMRKQGVSSVDDIDFSKLETANQDRVLQERARYSRALSGAVDQNALKANAKRTYNSYINVISNDETLAMQALHYDELSSSEKIDFIENLTNKVSQTRGCTGPTCVFDNDLSGTSTLGLGSADGIKLNPDIDNYSLEEILGTVAHEHNHYLDGHNKGVLNPTQQRLSQITDGVDNSGDATAYLSHLTEQASRAIDNEFLNHSIIEDIINNLPEHILMKLQ